MPADLRRGETVRIRDERWTVLRHHVHAGVAILDVCGCERSNRGVRTRFLLPFDTLDRLPAQDAIAVVSRRRWQHLARQVVSTSVPRYDSLRVVAAAGIDLLPFQLEPALAAVNGLAARILIADDVGLGKTIQAGLIVAEAVERDRDARVLVVCPAPLRSQWCDELASRFGLKSELFDSASLARLGTDLPPGVNPWAAQRLIVTSIDYVKRPDVLRALETVLWDLVVIDEAHGLAGTSDRHTAAALLARRARTVVMLTATPHSGDDEAFARLCRIGDVGQQFPLALFRRGKREAGLAVSRRTVWLRVRLDATEIAMHAALLRYARLAWDEAGGAAGGQLAMTVLLRRACSSATALARSVERRMALLAGREPSDAFSFSRPAQPSLPFDDRDEDEEPDAQLAPPALADAADERRHLETILRLARAAVGREGKLRVLRTLLRRVREPAIVFTEYRDTLTALAAEVAAFGCEVLHGGLLDDERQRALHRFTSGRTRLLLATDAAGEGLNLHSRCRLVVNLEVPWTPVRLEQRIGRVDRIGQQRRVHQLLLVADGTSEERTVAPHLRQRSARVARAFSPTCSPHADEHDIAERILVGDRPPLSEPAGTLPAGVFVPDLGARAAAEAERARTARAMMRPGAAADSARRPFAAALARRTTRGLWAFRVAVGPSVDDVEWETILAAAYTSVARPVASAAGIAALAELARGAVAPVISWQVLLAADLQAMHAAAAAALARERAIASELELRHARLAATLIQRGLFDRRVERDVAARREVLGEAMAACRERLARRERAAGAVVASLEPLFAVLLE